MVCRFVDVLVHRLILGIKCTCPNDQVISDTVWPFLYGTLVTNGGGGAYHGVIDSIGLSFHLKCDQFSKYDLGLVGL